MGGTATIIALCYRYQALSGYEWFQAQYKGSEPNIGGLDQPLVWGLNIQYSHPSSVAVLGS